MGAGLCPGRRNAAAEEEEGWWVTEEATAAELRWRSSVRRIVFLLRIRKLWSSELRARRHHAGLHRLVVQFKPLFRHLKRTRGELTYNGDSI